MSGRLSSTLLRGRGVRVAHQHQRAWKSTAAIASPGEHLVTLREIDRLVTSIARTSFFLSLLDHQSLCGLESSGNTYHPSPLAMRAHRIPWLSPTGASDNPWLTSSSPNLASNTIKQVKDDKLSDEEVEELERPRHMSESYTSFDLPLASDERLYDRYVNTSGGFRESCMQVLWSNGLHYQVWVSFWSVSRGSKAGRVVSLKLKEVVRP